MTNEQILELAKTCGFDELGFLHDELKKLFDSGIR
jgi:hypothetical protein